MRGRKKINPDVFTVFKGKVLLTVDGAEILAKRAEDNFNKEFGRLLPKPSPFRFSMGLARVFYQTIEELKEEHKNQLDK